MNGIDLFWFLTRLTLALVLGVAVGIINVFGGVIVSAAFFLVFPIAIDWLTKFFPSGIGRPECPSGCCHEDAFSWDGAEEGYPIYKCQCDERFLLKDREVLINRNGRWIPYRSWSKDRGWTEIV